MRDDDDAITKATKNPAFEMALKLETSIRADEAQIGYGPKNRAALGIAVVQQQSSLAEMNKRYGDTAPDDVEHQADPRLIEARA
jgi:hypothetical protein